MGRKKNPDKALNRKKSQEEYRHKVRRFTFQFSLHDAESREWSISYASGRRIYSDK